MIDMYINSMSEENKNYYIEKWLLLITLLVAAMIVVGGLTRLTDSGLSITKWDLISGILPPFSLDQWEITFNLYKKINLARNTTNRNQAPEEIFFISPTDILIDT